MRRAATVALIAGAAVLLLVSTAQAHALVRSSDPANGSEVQTAPAVVVVTFTEPPDPKLSFLHVLNSGGQEVEAGPSRPVPGEPLELEVPLPASLPNGTYTITWRTVSKTDGHVTGSSLTFGVGVRPTAQAAPTGGAPTTPSPPPLAVAGRWLFYWGVAVLLGASVVGLFVRSVVPVRGRSLLIAAWAVAAAGLVAMILAERSVIGISLGRLFASGTGRAFTERGVALVIVGASLGAFLIWRGRATLALLGMTAAGTMLVHVLAGHAAAEPRFKWLNVADQWVHVLAVGVWIGGLVWLLVGIRALDGDERTATVKRFSWIAGWALAVVALTGLSRALDEVGWPDHWRRLFDTAFGITVLLKVGLFGVLVALGARNRYRNVPREGQPNPGVGPLRRTVIAEIAVAALILGATGVMSELPPSASVAAAAARPTQAQNLVLSGHDFATTVRAQLTVTPGTVGSNRFVARVTDFDTGRPVPARAVSLTFSLPGQPEIGTPVISLSRTQDGLWSAQGTTISMFGSWEVVVLVQQATTSVSVPLRLRPRLPAQKITVARASGQPDLFTISLPGGATLQTYIDPGRAGRNVVHFTFFQASGAEQPISSASASAITPAGQTETTPLIRFDSGHFVANTNLASGRWTFLIQATARSGQVLSGYFTQEIPL